MTPRDRQTFTAGCDEPLMRPSPILSRVITLTDHLRLAGEERSLPGEFKAWHHFCVIGEGVELIINFSVMGDQRPAALPGSRLARVILLVHDAGWDGDVVEIPWQEVELQPGRIAMRLGQHRLAFINGVYHISIALETRPITLDLFLRPTTYPLMRNRATIGKGQIDWLVVPRLEATGTLVCGHQVHRMLAVPAYHDHNWGEWLWGQDFAWEWGFALPRQEDAPVSLVFDRITNRGRSQLQDLKLSLWKNDRLRRIFAHQEIHTLPQGYINQKRVPKFPRIMALLAPEMTTDVPRTLEIAAESGADGVEVCFEMEDLAQLVIPNETDLGETIINEVVGTVKAAGKLNGEKFDWEGRGFFEFLT
jgi:hypothetical protein